MDYQRQGLFFVRSVGVSRERKEGGLRVEKRNVFSKSKSFFRVEDKFHFLSPLRGKKKNENRKTKNEKKSPFTFKNSP